MSAAAIVPVIQAVGLFYGVKTVMEGITEKNLTKAVVGGIATYMGISSLGTVASSGATTGQVAAANGTEAGTSMLAAEQAGGAAAETAADGAMLSSLDQASGEVIGGQAAPNTLETAYASGSGANTGTGLVNAGTSTAAGGAAGGAAEKGLLSGLGDWVHDNQKLTYGAMQIGGNMMAGSAQQDWKEKMINEERAREDQARVRRGYWAPNPIPAKTRYNPRTGQFEQV